MKIRTETQSPVKQMKQRLVTVDVSSPHSSFIALDRSSSHRTFSAFSLSYGSYYLCHGIIMMKNEKTVWKFSFFFFNLFIFFYFIFKLYIIVLVLPNIKMNPPQVFLENHKPLYRLYYMIIKYYITLYYSSVQLRKSSQITFRYVLFNLRF